MSFQTATRFQWGKYTKTWVLRVFAASIICSIVVFGLTSLGWIGFVLGGILSTTTIDAILLWTVAEMIEDGLSQPKT